MPTSELTESTYKNYFLTDSLLLVEETSAQFENVEPSYTLLIDYSKSTYRFADAIKLTPSVRFEPNSR